jgi:hypothetical protein
MYSAIASANQKRYQIGRLGLSESPCHLICAVEKAKTAGADYVLWSAIERDGAEMRIVASLVSVISGGSIQDSRSVWVSELGKLQQAASRVSGEIAGVLVGKPSPVQAQANPGWNREGWANADDVARSMEAYRQKALGSPEYDRAHSHRNGGVALFILGFILDSAGGGLIGAGLPLGNTALVVAGGIMSGVGTIMFFTGIGVWASNQIRMNKIERGIPLSRSLRLEGLAPIVAAGDRGAPGLSARFAF